MAISGPEIEARIAKKVMTRKLRVRGMWWTMRQLIEENEGKYPGDLRTPEGAALTAEDLAELANTSAAVALSCLRSLEVVQLVKILSDKTTYHAPLLARLIEVRKGGRDRVREHRRARRVLRNTPKGVTSGGCNTHVTNPPPPDGLPPNPSSLSPSPPTSPAGEEIAEPGVRPGVSDAERQAAREAFDRWSQRDRGQPIEPLRNEHTPINALLENLAQEPPALRGGEKIPRHRLVPEAVAGLMSQGRPFKPGRGASAYACAAVESWIAENQSGTKVAAGFRPHSPPSQAPRKSNLTARVFGKV